MRNWEEKGDSEPVYSISLNNPEGFNFGILETETSTLIGDIGFYFPFDHVENVVKREEGEISVGRNCLVFQPAHPVDDDTRRSSQRAGLWPYSR